MHRPSRRTSRPSSRSRPRVRHDDGNVYQLRVELQGIAPPIWRRVQVSARASLQELHEVIERTMGRDAPVGGSGPGAGVVGYRFDIDGVAYVDEVEDLPSAVAVDSTSLEALKLHRGARFRHIAEHHGESWRHVVTLEDIGPRLVGSKLPRCVAGGRAAPPETTSGARDYAELLRMLADPLDPRSADRRSWLPAQFDPEYFNLAAINAALRRVEKRRPDRRREEG
jgi:Plasmid pRiA4b ORF-3-like protein